MRRSALDDSLRLLLNACAAAALLAAPGCAKDSGADGGSSETPYDDDGCGGGDGTSWFRYGLDVEVDGTVVSLTKQGNQIIALLREGSLVPVYGIGTAIVETLPGMELRAWVELSNGDKLAVGGGGQILRSASGTFEWTVVDAGITDDLIDIVADGERAVAIASERMLYTSDAGETWTELEPGSWTGLRRLFRAQGQLWLIGDGGQVWTTQDPSVGWDPVELGTSEDLIDGSEACGPAYHGDVDYDPCVVIVSASSIHAGGPGAWTTRPAPDGEVITAIGDRYLATDLGLYEVISSAGDLEEVDSLGITVTAITGGVEEIFVAGSTGELVRYYEEFSGCIGRPWMIDGVARTASLQAGQSDGWARDGLYEHASVASFARFVAELLALAAPPALIQAAQAAILDELEHARLCFELAAREHGLVRAGPLPLDPLTTARAGDPVALALAVFDEGCIGESVAAVEAQIAARESKDDDARRALEQIASDERRHAALAWKTLRWLVDRFGEPVRAALRGRLVTLADGGGELRGRVIAEVVRPLARELASRPAALEQAC